MKNARLFEDVEFWGEDTVKNLVFKVKYVNIFIGVINIVQDPIPDFDRDTTN